MTKNLNCILTVMLLLASTSSLMSAAKFEKPTAEDIAKCIRSEIDSDEKRIHIIKWMLEHPDETLPIAFAIKEDVRKDPFTVSAKYGTIEACTTSENAQSIIDRLLEPDTTDASKTTALEIAEKFGYQGERYRSVLLEVLSTTEFGGIQTTLLKLLSSYGREEDAELVLEIFKNSEVRNIKPVASDTLLAIGGPEIIGPWQEELARLREAEPERLRKQKEKIERLSEQEGITFGPMPEGPSWIDYIEEDLQSLKEKVAARQNTSSSNDKPDAVLKGEDAEPDARQKPANAGNRDTASKNESRKSLLLPGLALLIAITAATFFLIRRRT